MLVLLFIYAASSKLLDYDLFRFQIGKSPFLTGFATPVSIIVPAIEILIVTMLIINRWRIWGLYAALFLMILFTGYVYAILQYSDHIPCSCGGLISAMSWNQHLLFNVVITVLTIVAILFYKEAGKTSSPSF